MEVAGNDAGAEDEEATLGGTAPDAVGEVGLGLGALETERGVVVGGRSDHGGVEGADPDAGRLARVPDLRRPLAPRPSPHATIVPLRHRYMGES
jgi:hypothetical protein